MNKLALLLGSIVIVGGLTLFVRCNSVSYKAAHSGMHLAHTVKCYACGKVSDMSFAEMTTYVKAGKTADAPGQFKKFPCSSCGKIEASLYDGKYEDAQKQK